MGYRKTVTPRIMQELEPGDDADEVMNETKYDFRCRYSHPLYRITEWCVWLCHIVMPVLFLFTFQVRTKEDVKKDLLQTAVETIANATGLTAVDPSLIALPISG